MKAIGNFKAFGIGSLPYKTPKAAWDNVLNYFPDIPFWPQLPKRSYLENMYVQFSEHLPGRIVDLEKEHIYIDKINAPESELEKFFNDFLTNDLDKFAVSRDYCEGIYYGLELLNGNSKLFDPIDYIKGQITGPISFGLQIVDEALKPIRYDDMYHDITLKNLQRKAQWMEKILSKFNKKTIMSVDEPYLSSIGSGILNLNRDQIIQDIELIFQNINGLKAMHCCGNTDWSIITDTSLDILLFDGYNYMQNVALFTTDLQTFLDRGGCLGWGMVPSTPEPLAKETQESLRARFETGLELLISKGFDRDQLLQQSFLTPSCGLGPLTPELAETAMVLTKSLSEYIRTKYELE
jgi:hypothetical protein